MSKFRKHWFVLCLSYLIVTIFFIYYRPVPVIFPLDDSLLLLNPQVVSPLSLKGLLAVFIPGNNIDYYPVRDISYIVDHSFFYNDPAFIANHQFFLFCLSAIALYFIFKLIQFPRMLSIVFVAIWALHPMHTEMIFWLSARKDSLSLTFGIYSVLFFLLGTKKNNTNLLVISVLLLIFSLLTKASLALLPVAGLLAYFFGFFPNVNSKKLLKFLIVSTLVGLFFATLSNWFYSEVNDLRYLVPFEIRFQTSLAAFGKMCLGWINPSLNILDTENWDGWLNNNYQFVWAGIAVWFSLFVGLVYSFYAKSKRLAFFILTFILLYVPVSGLFFPHRNIYSVRYLEPGFLVFIVSLGHLTFRFFNKSAKSYRSALAFGTIGILTVLSFNEAKIWSDPIRVVDKALGQYPGSIHHKFLKWVTLLNKKQTEKSILEDDLVKACSDPVRLGWKACYQFWGNYVSNVGIQNEALGKIIMGSLLYNDPYEPPKTQIWRQANTLFYQLHSGSLEFDKFYQWADLMKWKPLPNHRLLYWLSECFRHNDQGFQAREILKDYYEFNLLLPTSVESIMKNNINQIYLEKIRSCQV